jgi:hypothetical protein
MFGFLVATIWGAQYVLITARLLASGTDTIDSIPASQPKNATKKTRGENDQASLSAEDITAGPEPDAEHGAALQTLD